MSDFEIERRAKEHGVIVTDFGWYFPPASVRTRWAQVRRAVRGRYERNVKRFCAAEWIAGERDPYFSPRDTKVAGK